MADKKQFSNTKSIVKVETGIVTLISYHHYLKSVGNNKLWPHMRKESWNIHRTKILICSIPLNGTDSYPSLEQKRTEGYVIVSKTSHTTQSSECRSVWHTQQSKNLLVLPKLLKITLNIINLNIYVYFFSLNFLVSQ